MRSIELAGRELLDLVEDEALAPDDPTLADVEHLHGGFELVVGEADDVEVLVAVADHLLLLDRPLDRGQAVAQPSGALELERGRRRRASRRRAG